MANKYGAKKVVIDGVKFDSKMEGDYYLYLKELKKQGIVETIEFQPKFLLQDSFKKRNILFRKIEYRADFKVKYSDGREEIVDVKGMETQEFKIKRKLFEYKFPYELKLVTFVEKWGGWIELDELKRLRKEAKKVKPK